MPQHDLKGLIQRFATREARAHRNVEPAFIWRGKRLSAIAIYEARFGTVPELFKRRTLPKLRSYNVQNGEYLWSLPRDNAQP